MSHDSEDQVAGHDEGATGEDVQRPLFGPVRVPRVEDDDEEGEDVGKDSQELTHRAFKAERSDDGRREICESGQARSARKEGLETQAKRTSEGVEGVGQAEVASGKGPELPALQAVDRFLLVKVLVGSLRGASLVSVRSIERSRVIKLTLGANGPMRCVAKARSSGVKNLAVLQAGDQSSHQPDFQSAGSIRTKDSLGIVG